MVSLADFSRAGTENRSRLTESFALLDDILTSSPSLQELPLVVMMNKVDLFNSRIQAGADFRASVPECPRDVAQKVDRGMKSEKREKKLAEVANDIVTWLAREVSSKTTFVSASHGVLTSFPTCATDVTMASTMVEKLFHAILSQSLGDLSNDD